MSLWKTSMFKTSGVNLSSFDPWTFGRQLVSAVFQGMQQEVITLLYSTAARLNLGLGGLA